MVLWENSTVDTWHGLLADHSRVTNKYILDNLRTSVLPGILWIYFCVICNYKLSNTSFVLHFGCNFILRVMAADD